jgi:hypothetical protein
VGPERPDRHAGRAAGAQRQHRHHAADINEAGTVVGYANFVDPPFRARPVVWR